MIKYIKNKLINKVCAKLHSKCQWEEGEHQENLVLVLRDYNLNYVVGVCFAFVLVVMGLFEGEGIFPETERCRHAENSTQDQHVGYRKAMNYFPRR